MSTKSTLLSLPCCHIYNDCIGANGSNTLAISVDYGIAAYLDTDENDYIEVVGNSDFAIVMRYLLKDKTDEELQAVIDQHRKLTNNPKGE